MNCFFFSGGSTHFCRCELIFDRLVFAIVRLNPMSVYMSDSHSMLFGVLSTGYTRLLELPIFCNQLLYPVYVELF